ncbi:MAG TPA: ferredoxin [Streptomyces sp.]|nr:ferredoxin [Streptomyces sp.]
MAFRHDDRLLDAPMQPVRCTACRARVEVRKSSWDQTSVQWNQDASRACLERRAHLPASGPNGGIFPGCSALREAVREAAARGDITVQEPDPQESQVSSSH